MKKVTTYLKSILILMLLITSCSNGDDDKELYPFIGNWAAISGYDQEYKNGSLVGQTDINYGDKNILNYNITLNKTPFYTLYFKETFEDNTVDEGTKSGRWSTNEVDRVTFIEEDEKNYPIDEDSFNFSVSGSTLILERREKSFDQDKNTYEYIEVRVFKKQ